jgi:hypothetical protein
VMLLNAADVEVGSGSGFSPTLFIFYWSPSPSPILKQTYSVNFSNPRKPEPKVWSPSWTRARKTVLTHLYSRELSRGDQPDNPMPKSASSTNADREGTLEEKPSFGDSFTRNQEPIQRL